MILRELITRFGFEVSKKDVNKYESTVKGLTSRALKFAAIFGAAFSVKGLINAGLSAEQAKFNFEQLAGVNFSKFKNVLADIRKEMNSIREGSGQLFTDKNFFLASSSFVKDFGSGDDSLMTFKDILSSSAKLAAGRGMDVNKIVAAMQNGLNGGGFDFLKEFPEFTQVSVNKANELNKIYDPGEFGHSIGIGQKMSSLRGFLNIVRGGQNQALRDMPDTLLKANQAAKEFENTMDKSGKSFNKVLVPVTNFLSKEAKHGGDFIDQVDKEGFVDTLLKTIFSDKGFNFIKGNSAKKPSVNKVPVPTATGTINRSPSTINITNHIKVVSDDPRKAAAITAQKIDDTFSDARHQLNKTEDRGDR